MSFLNKILKKKTSISFTRQTIDLNVHSFTIYNTIPAQERSNPSYGWRKVITQCNAQQGTVTVQGNNSQTVSNKTTLFCYGFKEYLSPTFLQGGYYSLSEEERANHFTIAPSDFIVFDVVDDEINHASSSEFNALKDKYKHIGMTVESAFAYLNGLSTDHLEAISL